MFRFRPTLSQLVNKVLKIGFAPMVNGTLIPAAALEQIVEELWIGLDKLALAHLCTESTD